MSTPYQIYACAESGRAVYDSGVHAGQFHASYTEAVAPQLALERCLEQFPTTDGWTKHYVKNIDTQVEFGNSEDVGFDLEDF